MEAFRTSDGTGTVAVALDGSPASSMALAVARRLADQLGARLSLLHLPAHREPDLALAGSHLRHRATDDRGAFTRHGRTVSPILDVANDPATLLVALGVGRDTDQLDFISSRVIEQVAGALLLIPSSCAPSEWLGLRRLLVPLDGAPSTFRALAPIVRLAARLGAALDLLYIADPDAPPAVEPGTLHLPPYLDQPHHAWAEWQQEVHRTLAASAGLASLPVPSHIYTASGPAAEATLLRAAKAHADAITLVHRGHLDLNGASILHTLLERASWPILLAPAVALSRGRLRRWRPA